jgi:hypothetical protein
MEIFELAIHSTGYPIPVGYDDTCATSELRQEQVVGNEQKDLMSIDSNDWAWQ